MGLRFGSRICAQRLNQIQQRCLIPWGGVLEWWHGWGHGVLKASCCHRRCRCILSNCCHCLKGSFNVVCPQWYSVEYLPYAKEKLWSFLSEVWKNCHLSVASLGAACVFLLAYPLDVILRMWLKLHCLLFPPVLFTVWKVWARFRGWWGSTQPSITFWL